MPALTYPITTNGDYDIEPGHPFVLIMGSGDFSSGVLTLSVKNPTDGTFIPVAGGSWLDDFEEIYEGAGNDVELRFTLTGAITPDISIHTKAVYHG